MDSIQPQDKQEEYSNLFTDDKVKAYEIIIITIYNMLTENKIIRDDMRSRNLNRNACYTNVKTRPITNAIKTCMEGKEW